MTEVATGRDIALNWDVIRDARNTYCHERPRSEHETTISLASQRSAIVFPTPGRWPRPK
jgi:hypothetical protein